MKITDEAVEAALAARHEFKNQRGMDNAANLMRHILEASAPHIAAEAWEAGYIAHADGVLTRNPYRPTP